MSEETSERVKPCDIPCPKCGSNEITRRFKSVGVFEHPAMDPDEMRRTEFVRVDKWNTKVHRDCVMHHCRACQFDWETEPLHGEKEKPNERT